MHTGSLQHALDYLRLADGGLSDAQLLTRFIDGNDQSAFAALVRRHGAMVLGVCQRVLGHAEDAEDAFQAAFLVLSRRAPSVVKREAVASFLYGVAYRTACSARARAVRRRATERQVDDMPHPEVLPTEPQDWRPLLDQELSRLPEKYRAAIVLCDLEGKTRREAARLLNLPESTLTTRLMTGRKRLARQLTRAGLVLSGGSLAVLLAEGALAAVPAPWISATAAAAAGTGAATAPATILMREVVMSMLLTKLKTYVAVALLAVLVGAGGLAYRASGQDTVATRVPPVQGQARPLTDVEVLQREVAILKAQVALLQNQVRNLSRKATAPQGPKGGAEGPPVQSKTPIIASSNVVGHVGPTRKTPQTAADALRQAEDALQTLRTAKDEKVREAAAEALAHALWHLGRFQPRAANQFVPGPEDPLNIPHLEKPK
jgi:RNA polymerase sigma factor (sigma-70 family)